MKNTEILQKRCFPALDEMFKKAECVFSEEDLVGTNFVATYKNVCEYTELLGKPAQIPFMAFYIDDKIFDEIREKYGKRFQYYWRFVGNISPMFKSERENIEKMLESSDQGEVEYARAELERDDRAVKNRNMFNKYMSEVERVHERAEKEEMPKSKVNREIAKIAKKYGCQRRSNDREAYMLYVCDAAPNSNIETFNEIKRVWRNLHDKIKPILDKYRDVGDRESFVKESVGFLDGISEGSSYKWMAETIKVIFFFYTNIVFDTRTNELKFCRKN